MARAATHAGAPCGVTQDIVGIKCEVAEIDQIGLGASDRLRTENLARPIKRFLVQLRARRQHGVVAAAQRKRIRIVQQCAQEQ